MAKLKIKMEIDMKKLPKFSKLCKCAERVREAGPFTPEDNEKYRENWKRKPLVGLAIRMGKKKVRQIVRAHENTKEAGFSSPIQIELARRNGRSYLIMRTTKRFDKEADYILDELAILGSCAKPCGTRKPNSL